MLSKELKEKKRRFFSEVHAEVDRFGQEHCLLFPELREHISRAFSVLQKEGDYLEAKWHLRDAYKSLVYSYMHRYIPGSPTEEQFRYALNLLDLGIFGFQTEVLFLSLQEVVPYLWEAREDFLPNLSDALHVAYLFRCWIEAGINADEAFTRSLSVCNALYQLFGDNCIYRFRETISMLLTPETMAKLRQILLNVYRIDTEPLS
jgi:hypothetical protein